METNEVKIFEVVLQTISTGLVEKIISETGVNEDDAMESLYSSSLYSILEKEKTKMWHYSVPMLFDLYQEEKTAGKFEIPDY